MSIIARKEARKEIEIHRKALIECLSLEAQDGEERNLHGDHRDTEIKREARFLFCARAQKKKLLFFALAKNKNFSSYPLCLCDLCVIFFSCPLRACSKLKSRFKKPNRCVKSSKKGIFSRSKIGAPEEIPKALGKGHPTLAWIEPRQMGESGIDPNKKRV